MSVNGPDQQLESAVVFLRNAVRRAQIAAENGPAIASLLKPKFSAIKGGATIGVPSRRRSSGAGHDRGASSGEIEIARRAMSVGPEATMLPDKARAAPERAGLFSSSQLFQVNVPQLYARPSTAPRRVSSHGR